MASQIGSVSMNGLFHEDAMYGVYISGTVTQADIGKALTIDTTAANTFKLAGDDAVIHGRLESFEDRTVEGVKVGTMAAAGVMKFPVNPNASASAPDETPVVGDHICGGTATGGLLGYVQNIASGGQQKWLVVEIMSGFVIAMKV